MSAESYAITEEEWSRHRHDLAQLYLSENKPLKKVQQIMETKYGFRATKRMYTARMKKWGFKKNYRAEEKDFLVTQITEALANGQPLSTITLKGEAIKYHRVLRHWMAKESEKEAVPSRVPPPQPIYESAICSGTKANQRQKETFTMLPKMGLRTTSAPSVTPRPSRNTYAHCGSTHASESTFSMQLCCEQQEHDAIDTKPIFFTIARPGPGELIFQATSSYLDSFSDTLRSTKSLIAQSRPLELEGVAKSVKDAVDANDASDSNGFWHDFETALYLLQIGSSTLGWAAFHTTWVRAAENILSDPVTLLRKLITTLTLTGKLGKFPDALRLVLTFIADLLQLRLGAYHPFVHIRQQLQLDEHSPWTSEATLCLMRDMLERHLGPFHRETFHTHISLIVCQRQNRNLIVAEELTRSLIQQSQSCPDGAGQLLRALRKLTHVLKDQLRYEEAVEICYRILSYDSDTLSNELAIYTKEDLAELHRLQGHLAAESWYLSEALTVSQRCSGYEAAPTLHIYDKLQISLAVQESQRVKFKQKEKFIH